MTPELFLERGGELRIVREDFSVYVRYCYVHLSKFSFFSFFPCPFFLIFFSKQIAIPTSIYLQNLASIQPRTSLKKFESSSSLEFELKLQNFKTLVCSPICVFVRLRRFGEPTEGAVSLGAGWAFGAACFWAAFGAAVRRPVVLRAACAAG